MTPELNWRQVARHEYYAGTGLMLVSLYPLTAPLIPIIGWLNTDGDITVEGMMFVWAFVTFLATIIFVASCLRIRKILRICREGRIVVGEVVSNYYAPYRNKPPGSFPAGGAMVVRYESDGEARESWIALWRTRACEAIDARDSIRLCVDSRQPDFAIPVDLFAT